MADDTVRERALAAFAEVCPRIAEQLSKSVEAESFGSYTNADMRWLALEVYGIAHRAALSKVAELERELKAALSVVEEAQHLIDLRRRTSKAYSPWTCTHEKFIADELLRLREVQEDIARIATPQVSQEGGGNGEG